MVLGGIDDSSRHSPASNHFWGWASILFFGLAALKGILGLARPTHVVLTPVGFQVKDPASRPLVPWKHVDRFFVTQIRSTKIISYDLKPETKTALERAWGEGTGWGDGHIPTLLEKGTEEMLSLLEEWRHRHAPSGQ